jgi:AcrR family transcriptional regulator
MIVAERTRGRRRRTRGRPKLEDVAELESKLLAVALKEFMQHGYGGASMARIVRIAGVSKTTLYSRFPSKELLFRAIIREQIEHLSAATTLRSVEGRPSLEQGLLSYADRSLATSLEAEHLQVNRLIYSESHRFPELGKAAAERTEMGVQQIAGFIRERAEADRVPCRDPEGAAEAFIFMLRGWYVNVMLTNRKVTPAQRRQWVERAVHALIAGRAEW